MQTVDLFCLYLARQTSGSEAEERDGGESAAPGREATRGFVDMWGKNR
jgi:hypothetical protein